MPTYNGVVSPRPSVFNEYIDATSERLVQARRLAAPLSAFPGELPSDIAVAYAIQQRSISRWQDEVAGWKVGGVPHGFTEIYAATRLAGPIFKQQLISSLDTELVVATVFDSGFAAVEAELILCTAVHIRPSETGIDHRRMRDAIASIHIGAEIASSPMRSINDLGPGAIISDFGNNGGLVVGPSIPNWHQRSEEDIDISVLVNKEIVGSVKTRIEVDTFNALEFLVELSSARGIDLPAGTFVTCGALSGIHEVKPGDCSSVVFEGLGTLNIRFAKRQPTV